MSSHPVSLHRLLVTFTGCTLLTLGVGLTVGWPATTHAEVDPLALWVSPGTAVGSTVAEGRLVRDQLAKSGWSLEIKVKNPTDRVERCDLVAVVTEARGNPMARVMPPPQVAWKARHSLSVQPHAEVVRRIPVTVALAAKLNAAAPKPAAAQAGNARNAAPAQQAQEDWQAYERIAMFGIRLEGARS